MKKILFLFIVISFSFLLFSCASSVSQFKETCQQEYDYFPDAEDCLQRKFIEATIEQESGDVLLTIHTDIIFILKQKLNSKQLKTSKNEISTIRSLFKEGIIIIPYVFSDAVQDDQTLQTFSHTEYMHMA